MNDNFNGLISYGEVILPDNIHIAVGRQCNLWWSTVANIAEGDKSVYFEVKCDVGMTTSRGFLLDGVEQDIGDHTITIRCRDLRTRTILGEKTSVIHVVPNKTGSGKKNILMIGDSRTWHSVSTNQGFYNTEAGNKTTTTEMRKLFKSDSKAEFTFLGTKVSELDSEVRNLADNGWTYATAIEEIERAGGMKKYIEEACGAGEDAKLDYVTVMYGCNDTSDWHQNNLDQYERSIAKFDTIIGNAKKLFSMILEAYPDCKPVLVLESSLAANQDGFGYWYGTRNDCMTDWEFVLKALRKRVIKEFDRGAFDERITLSTAGLWCDRLWSYPYLTYTASERADYKKVEHLINCAHPHDAGYKQIADGDFSTIMYLEDLAK